MKLHGCQLNYLHRMAARVVFVLVWVHAGTKVSSKDSVGYVHFSDRDDAQISSGYDILSRECRNQAT